MRIRIGLFAMAVVLLTSCQNDPVHDAIAAQLRQYPESRVQDIYKNFCQDNLGPGHLIPNPEAARTYLMSELQEYREDLDKGLYEMPAERFVPLGDKASFVRVDLSVVLDSLVDAETLLSAFVRSANDGFVLSEEEWKAKWATVAAVIRRDFSDIPDAARDLAAIDSLIAQGELILHHSSVFEATYHPHYRIVARQIAEEELF